MDWQFFDVWCGLPNYLPMSVGLSVWTTREPGLPNKTSPDPGHALSPPPRNVLDSGVHSVDVGQRTLNPKTLNPPMQHARWMWCVDRKLFFIAVLSHS
jgi:hypothetical protein